MSAPLDSIVEYFKGLHDKLELSSSNVGKQRTNHIASDPEIRLSQKCWDVSEVSDGSVLGANVSHSWLIT